MVFRTAKSKMKNIVLILLIIFTTGCGSSWSGKIVYLKDGNILIKSDSGKKTKDINNLLIYRQEIVTHPVTGEILGEIRDDIAEIQTLMVMENIIWAYAQQPWFDMMKINDRARQTKRASKQITGSIENIGKVEQIINENTLKIGITNNKIVSGGKIAVIKYVDMVHDTETGNIISAVLEPVAYLKMIDETGIANYELLDKNLGWVEIGDSVVMLAGDLSNMTILFQRAFEHAQDLLYRRNYLRALRYINSGLYREAILELNEVSKFDPQYKDTDYLIGLCYLNLNRYEDAERIFNDSLKNANDDPKIWIALAYNYIKQNRIYEALTCYQKSAELMKSNAKIWVDIGDIYRSMNDDKNAEISYRKALEIDPNDQEAIYELQKILNNTTLKR